MPKQDKLNLHNLILFAGLFIIVFNSFHLYKEIKKNSRQHERRPYTFLGDKFGGLETLFKNVDAVGYYTDRSLDDPLPAAQFAQAQYIVAPTILDFNNFDHEFILFDCSSKTIAYQKMKEVHAIPLKENKHGIILARKIP